MKRTIRFGVFETNSSSTHSLTMVSKEEFEKWKKGELVLIDYKNSFINKEDAEEYTNKYSEDGVFSYDEYQEEYLEYFEQEYTTKSGDTVVAFGLYGYEG
jgi:hypothetical protein